MSSLDEKVMSSEHVESVDFTSDPEIGKTDTFGTVALITHDEVVLIPTPTRDPRDPLNLPRWRRLLIMIVTALFGTFALTVVSGVGAVGGWFEPQYSAEGYSSTQIGYLFTFPALTMGIGNFISMPIALAVGRRSVFLASCLLLAVSSLLCALNNGYVWHLSARLILGLAAGQSEALTPMMIQETHFLHERGTVLTAQWLIQSLLAGLLSTISSYQTAALGLRWWYGFYAILTFVLFVVGVFFVPETKYNRPLSAYEGVVEKAPSMDKIPDDRQPTKMTRVTTKTPREVDLNKFQPRTFWSDLSLVVGTPDWKEAALCYKHMAQLFCFPNVFFVVLMNGVLLGIQVAIGRTYGNILQAPPYSWPDSSVGFAQGGQIVVFFLGFPLLGYFSDWVVKKMSIRNGGVHEPESRLIPLVFPTIIGIIACVIFGQAGSYPAKYNWFAIVFGYCAQYFSFVGSSIAGQTYLLDAYPSRQGGVLVLVCAARGVIQFGLSYGVTAFQAKVGYAVVFGTYGGLTALFGVLAIIVFFTGKHIRNFTQRWVVDKEEDEKRMGAGYHVAGVHSEHCYLA